MEDRTMDGAIDDAMSYDPILEAEKTVQRLTGNKKHSYKDETPEAALNMALSFGNVQRSAKHKKELAKINRDTHFRSPLSEVFPILEDLGFKQVLKLEIPKYADDTEERPSDFYYIYATEDGLLLTFDTYWGSKQINGGRLLFNWATNDPEMRRVPGGEGISGGWKALNREENTIRSSQDFAYKWDHETQETLVDEWRDYCREGGWVVWPGYYDCREFLRRRVEGLRSSGVLLPVWAKRPYLSLLHYNDTRCSECAQSTSWSHVYNRCICKPQKTYDSKEITKQRVAQADPLLRRIIGVDEDND
jgi:hypothetical protein